MRVTDDWVQFAHNAIAVEGYKYPIQHTREVLETGEVVDFHGPASALWYLCAAREALSYILSGGNDKEVLYEKLSYSLDNYSRHWFTAWETNMIRYSEGKPVDVNV